MEVVSPPPAWDQKRAAGTSGEVGASERRGGSATVPRAASPASPARKPIDGDETREMPASEAEALHKLVAESHGEQRDVSPSETAQLHFSSSSSATEPRGARLVEVTANGQGGRKWDIEELPFDIGRSQGHLVLEDDPYLCERHARILKTERGFQIRDLSALNGIFVRISSPEPVIDRDLVLIGDTLLRFEGADTLFASLQPAVQDGVRFFGTPLKRAWARLRVLTEAGVSRDIFYLFEPRVVVGGGGPAGVSLLADPKLSAAHVAFRQEGERIVAEDLDSARGTFLKVRGARALHHDDTVLIGQTRFRFEIASS
jgi:pSer/pThr/pTyr-binding forkhead associated (FHA) protein